MFEKWQRGDYKDLVKFNKEDVEVWLKKVEGFIRKIEELTMEIIKEGISIKPLGERERAKKEFESCLEFIPSHEKQRNSQQFDIENVILLGVG